MRDLGELFGQASFLTDAMLGCDKDVLHGDGMAAGGPHAHGVPGFLDLQTRCVVRQEENTPPGARAGVAFQRDADAKIIHYRDERGKDLLAVEDITA